VVSKRITRGEFCFNANDDPSVQDKHDVWLCLESRDAVFKIAYRMVQLLIAAPACASFYIKSFTPQVEVRLLADIAVNQKFRGAPKFSGISEAHKDIPA
jgi:hypothetical protein